MVKRIIGKLGEAIGGVCLIATCVLFRPLLRPWYSKWGVAVDELTQILPGDEYVSHPRGGYIQSISIKGSCHMVWPWLAQIGQDKGGFYSYELLENIVGCNIHNSNRILTEHQSINVGDMLVMHPKAPKIPVVIVEPEKVLVYGGRQDENTSNVWIFFITGSEQFTRLTSKWVFDYKPSLINKVTYNWLIEPIAAVMQRKMLYGIKKRVETTDNRF